MASAQIAIRQLVVGALALFGLTVAAFSVSIQAWGGAIVGAIILAGPLTLTIRRKRAERKPISDLV